MNFCHSLVFSCMYYFKIYLGALQIRRLYVDGGGLAIMAAGHDPCRRLLIIFLGGLYFILPALRLTFTVYFPLFIFSFPFFSQKMISYFTVAAIWQKQSAWRIKDVGCPFSFKKQVKSRVLSFLPSLPRLLSWDGIKQSCFMSDRTSYMHVSQHPSCRVWFNGFRGYLIMSALSTFKNAPDVLLQWDCLQNQL